MQNFYCVSGERVRVAKVYDFILKNSNLSLNQLNTFSDILCDVLGLENVGFDEVTVDEFDSEFIEHFKNNKSAMEAWKIVKTELQINNCEIWV